MNYALMPIICSFQQYHASECPDRASFDRYKFGIQSGTVKNETPAQNTFQVVESEECWDDVSLFKLMLFYHSYCTFYVIFVTGGCAHLRSTKVCGECTGTTHVEFRAPSNPSSFS